MPPLVSVVLTTYNQARWLPMAIDSVIAQTYPHWELMLVDNGSTDDTPAILDRYRQDPRIRVTRYETNQFHTVISNRAIAESSGDLIAILYGDDYFLPEKLAKQLAKFSTLSSEYGAVYCQTYRLNESTHVRVPAPSARLRGHILEHLLIAQPFWPIAPLIRRECWQRYPFNEALFMEGESLFTKIGMRWAFDYVDDYLCVMRDHDSNMGKEIEPSLLRNLKILEALFAHADFPDRYRYLEHPTFAWIHRMKGWEAIRTTRQYPRGREWLLTALRHQPSALLNLRMVLGLALSNLPPVVSNRILDVANLVFGKPPAPPKQFYGV